MFLKQNIQAAELCSSNWSEINYLLGRVKLLESLLKENGIKIPD
ncbi:MULTISPECIES: mobility-associated LCxxNW protein [Blautia]|nr:mobility-associated LCxxNW protein [Blautia parvula]MCB4352838.1 mobility-associated LCxxNW protein [Blautia sp. RD014232]UBU24558.1 mobility-associated LCxxNW protein [Blautia parvula]